MKVLACMLTLPLALVGWQWWGDRSMEHALAPVASEIAGREVEVDCQSFWSSLLDIQWRQGEVRFDGNGMPEARIFLTRATCQRLYAFGDDGRHEEVDCLRSHDWSGVPPTPPHRACYDVASPTVYALLVLAHEAYHTAGVRNEAETNCYAIQAMAYAATRLGGADDEARLLALAMASLAPHQRSGYATTECRHGSPLDLHPETPEFPSERVLVAPRGLGGSLGRTRPGA
jgi:hypothetical protein